MGDVVNLRRFRKARDRADKAVEAASRRASFGRAAAERDTTAAERLRGEAALDRHRIDLPDDAPSR